MSYPRRRVLHWDETQSNNEVVVPFLHIWRVHQLFLKLATDATVATRTFSLQFFVAVLEAGLQDFSLFSKTQTASLTTKHFLGFIDGQSDNLSGAVDIGQPIMLFGSASTPDKIKLAITNEQSGDTYEVYGVIDDWVIPRP